MAKMRFHNVKVTVLYRWVPWNENASLTIRPLAHFQQCVLLDDAVKRCTSPETGHSTNIPRNYVAVGNGSAISTQNETFTG